MTDWETSEFFDWMEEHDKQRRYVEKARHHHRKYDAMRREGLISTARYQGEMMQLAMFPGLTTA